MVLGFIVAAFLAERGALCFRPPSRPPAHSREARPAGLSCVARGAGGTYSVTHGRCLGEALLRKQRLGSGNSGRGYPLMLSTTAKIIVLVLGFSVAALSIWGIVRPDRLMGLVSSVLERKWGMLLGVFLRLILGAALIVAAPISAFPYAFEILGWIVILAALGLAIMGQRYTRRLIAWFDRLAAPMIRLWLLLGLAFGGFLVYGSI